MTFEHWKEEINRMMQDEFNLDLNDIDDWSYRYSFEAGDTPKEAFNQLVEDMEIYDDDDLHEY
jgi:hypothetical protein